MDLSNVYNDFRQYGYTWKIGGVDTRPSLADFTKAVESMVESLRNQPDNTQVEMGHLIIKAVHLDPTVYDVYIHATTLNPDMEQL